MQSPQNVWTYTLADLGEPEAAALKAFGEAYGSRWKQQLGVRLIQNDWTEDERARFDVEALTSIRRTHGAAWLLRASLLYPSRPVKPLPKETAT